MDQLTHNVRRANWLNIIKQCQERPANVTVRQCLKDNDIKEKGLLFIKSMMSMNNVNRQKELDQTYALSVGIECEQTVVDDGASTSVDRPQMRQLMEILEISDYKVLVVEDIYEITRNPEDLKSMMDRINDLGVTIFDLGTMSARYNNYAIEC